MCCENTARRTALALSCQQRPTVDLLAYLRIPAVAETTLSYSHPPCPRKSMLVLLLAPQISRDRGVDEDSAAAVIIDTSLERFYLGLEYLLPVLAEFKLRYKNHPKNTDRTCRRLSCPRYQHCLSPLCSRLVSYKGIRTEASALHAPDRRCRGRGGGCKLGHR